MWSQCQRLRKFLRTESQRYQQKKHSEGDHGPVDDIDHADASGAAAGSPDGGAGSATSEGGDDGETDDPEAAAAEAAGFVRERRFQPVELSNMKELQQQSRSLALLLMQLRPARVPATAADGGSGTSSKEDNLMAPPNMLRQASADADSMGLTQLRAKWAEVLPVHVLQPLMRRWQAGEGKTDDEDGAPDGLEGVLARQASWQRSASAGLEDAADEEVGMVGRGASHELALRGASDAGAVGLVSVQTAAEAAAGAVVDMVVQVHCYPAPMLKRLLFWRLERARSRVFGLRALGELLDSLALASAQCDALRSVRAGLSGDTERK